MFFVWFCRENVLQCIYFVYFSVEFVFIGRSASAVTVAESLDFVATMWRHSCFCISLETWRKR